MNVTTQKPELRNVNPLTLKPHEQNPRVDTKNPELLANMRGRYQTHGVAFDPQYPVVVNVRDDGTEVLCKGHIRTATSCHLIKIDEFGADTIPAYVYTGLSREQELELLFDHASESKPLDKFERYLAFITLEESDWIAQIDNDPLTGEPFSGQKAIAVRLGLRQTRGKEKNQPSKNVIREYTAVRRLENHIPNFRDHYYSACTKAAIACFPDDTGNPQVSPLKAADVAGLSTALSEDIEANRDPMTHALGDKWQSILNPAPKTVRPSADDLRSLISETGEGPIASALRVASGDEPLDDGSKLALANAAQTAERHAKIVDVLVSDNGPIADAIANGDLATLALLRDALTAMHADWATWKRRKTFDGLLSALETRE